MAGATNDTWPQGFQLSINSCRKRRQELVLGAVLWQKIKKFGTIFV